MLLTNWILIKLSEPIGKDRKISQYSVDRAPPSWFEKVSKPGAKIRNRYNQEPHLTQDSNGKVTTPQTRANWPALSQQDCDHKAQINRCAQRHNKHKTEKTHKRSTKEVGFRVGMVSKIFYWRAQTGFTAPTSPLIQMWIKTHKIGLYQCIMSSNI